MDATMEEKSLIDKLIKAVDWCALSGPLHLGEDLLNKYKDRLNLKRSSSYKTITRIVIFTESSSL